MPSNLSLGRILRGAFFGACAFTTMAVVAVGCLDRPVAKATPTVSARIVTPAKQNKVSKIDLLFMIDNSSSMADKQQILAAAVPDLVSRLVDPVCIDPMTGQQVGFRDVNGACAQGEPDFDPVKDIHIGIISSSLGGHGSTGVCDDPDMRKTLPHNDDHGHLLHRDSMDGDVPTFMGQGFLNWNPVGANSNQMAASIIMPFQTMVTGVGQHGCGYEASLEAIYRFLIEPQPYKTVELDMTQNPVVAVLKDQDDILLQQRYDFLRPDSLVAVMMITDENDCSVVDPGQGYLSIIPASGAPPTSVLGHGTSQCLTNPNDPCCVNCGQAAPTNCPDHTMDPECLAGAWTRDKDPENLRCWHQKQRYGVDFLYNPLRYVNGFKNSVVPDRNGMPVKNPLYSDLTSQCRMTGMGCAGERDKSLVFVAGLVGVPWQDIAVDPNDLKKGYLTATQIADMNVWPKILGDPNASPPVPPTDSHMIESITPRAGLAPPNSAANADPINGHEWDPSMANPTPNADLQYACIFPLGMPKTCTEQTDCDCFVPPMGNAAAAQNPLCQGAGGYSNVQVRAKGYPGTRELEVLQGLGEQAIVASICPSNVSNTTAADFGYRPAIAALISRLRNALRGRCLPRQLAVDTTTGAVPCVIVEAFNPPAGATCNCLDKPGRLTADPQTITPEVRASCSGGCTCFCEIKQLDDPDKTICETAVSPPGTVQSGWCYVDPSQGGANAMNECEIVKTCPPTDKRIIRFVNPDSEPRAGATAFIMCQESSFPQGGQGAPMNPCP
jgi:hypothetical protein